MKRVPRDFLRSAGSNSFVDRELAFTASLLRNARVPVEGVYDGEATRNFFRAVGNYFQAPQAEIEEVRLLCREVIETPVVFHISRHASVASEEVAREHLAGRSWKALFLEHHVHPETFHVTLATGFPASPARPYRYHRRAACEAWKSQTLADEDIVNLVNLRFACSFYRVPPDQVIALRLAGWSYLRLHAALWGDRCASEWDDRTGLGVPADSDRRAVAGTPRG